MPGIFDAGFLFAGKGLVTPAKKLPGRLNLPGVLISYDLFLMLVIDFGETVKIDFQFNLFAFFKLFPFGKIHVVFFCLGLAFLILICSGHGIVLFFTAGSLAVFKYAKTIELTERTQSLGYTDIDGIVYSADRKTLLVCPGRRTKPVNIPEGTETISSFAFAESMIESVYMPDS